MFTLRWIRGKGKLNSFRLIIHNVSVSPKISSRQRCRKYTVFIKRLHSGGFTNNNKNTNNNTNNNNNNNNNLCFSRYAVTRGKAHFLEVIFGLTQVNYFYECPKNNRKYKSTCGGKRKGRTTKGEALIILANSRIIAPMTVAPKEL
jgi:hypothetical protein